MEPPSARAMAIAAASAAVANVAPGQRYRAIEQATKAVIARHQRQGQEPASSSYEPPEWGGCPKGVPFSLDILREGSVLETRPLADEGGKGHYTFGRSPDSDFILEHPSASRFHAVLQFNASTHEAFLYDQGSTHGTFLNKNQIKSRIYVPLPVGSTFKLGQSSRIYVFNGPLELMPEEGLNRAQKRQLAQIEHARMMMEKDKRTAQAQMQVAIGGGGGNGSISWGMGEDAVDPSSFDIDDVEWRSYANSGSLNDRQRKLADKVRAKEFSISNMRTEIERIQAKEKLEAGLTPGQASTIARNETAIAKMTEEIADLEDMLNESVRQALRDKAKERGEDVAEEEGKRKKRHKGMDDEDLRYLQASDDEDEFFDRTRSHKVRSVANEGGQAGKDVVEVVSAESLHGEREALLDEKKRIEALIEAAALEVGQESNETKPAGTASATEDDNNGGQDVLDAYLMHLKEDVREGRVKALKKDLVEIEGRLERVKKLLKIADPDGWMSSQSSKVAAAKSLAAKALLQRSKVPEPSVALKAVNVPFVEEMEEEEEDEAKEVVLKEEDKLTDSKAAPSDDPGHRIGGLVIRKPQNAAGLAGEVGKQPSKPINPQAAAAAKQLMAEMNSGREVQPKGSAKPSPLSLLGANRKALVVDMAADAKVNEYMELMERREREMKAIEEIEEVWIPPSNQDGSGRSSLNEKFNY